MLRWVPWPCKIVLVVILKWPYWERWAGVGALVVAAIAVFILPEHGAIVLARSIA